MAPAPASPRLGIVGGGQLGRMLALAAAPLGVAVTVLDPAEDAGAAVAAGHIRAAYDDVDALRALAGANDVVSFEFENVPAAALEAVADAAFAPPPRALAVSQDRLDEKQLFASLGIPTAPHAAVDSAESLVAALDEIGRPAILKTRRLGYDGKGQVRIGDDSDPAAVWDEMAGAPSLLEGTVAFERELSVVAARSPSGEIAYYPLSENVHRDGILRTSTVPADASDAVEEAARAHAKALLEELDYVGVLALELFLADGALIANEFAPRVHNSGHWTIDGAPTSQFENHVRAVLGLPLGATEPVQPSVMFNLIGGLPDAGDVLAVPGAHLHLYGKQPRRSRKLGHITVTTAAGTPLAHSIAVVRELVDASADG